MIRDAGTAAFHSVAVGVAAFAGSGLSPLLNVAHLGLFCAIQLTVQLLLALCLLPACLVLYHNWLEPKPNLVCMCLLKTRLLNGTPGTRVAKAGDVAGKATLFASVSQIWQPLEQTSTEHHHATRMIEATLPGLQQLQSVPKGSRTWPLPRLLGRWFLPLVENPKARALLLLFFALLLVPVGFGVGGASVAQVPQQRLPPRHPLRLTRTTIERNFRPSSREQTVAATLLWGVAGVARGGSDDGGNRWSVDLVRNSSFYGEIEWRDAEAFVFDATAQEHVHAACSLLRRQAWVRATRAGHCRGRRRRSMFRRRVAHVAQQRIDAPQPFVRVWSFPNRGRADGGPRAACFPQLGPAARRTLGSSRRHFPRGAQVCRSALRAYIAPERLALAGIPHARTHPTLPVLTRTAPAGRPRRVSRGCRTSRRLSPRWHLPPSARLSTRHPGFGCGPALRLCCLMKRSSAPRAPPRSRSRCS